MEALQEQAVNSTVLFFKADPQIQHSFIVPLNSTCSLHNAEWIMSVVVV
jgi:hypothetical protein